MFDLRDLSRAVGERAHRGRSLFSQAPHSLPRFAKFKFQDDTLIVCLCEVASKAPARADWALLLYPALNQYPCGIGSLVEMLLRVNAVFPVLHPVYIRQRSGAPAGRGW